MIAILKDEEFRAALRNSISGARREILISTYKLDYTGLLSTRHMNAIIEALARARKRGVSVRCLINMDSKKSTLARINMRAKILLEKKGILVKTGPEGRTYHAKLIIIDEEVAFIGSHNLSESSICRNFEVSLMIDNPEILLQLHYIYLKEWERAKS